MPEYGTTSRIENEREIVLEKIFLAPKEQLFEMYTDTSHLENFWAPNGWELFHCVLDFQPEGEWYYGMREINPMPNPENHNPEYWRKVIYEEIDRPNRLVFAEFFADKMGEINRELPKSETTIDFTTLDDERTMIVSRTIYDTPEALQELLSRGIRESMAESLERLSNYIAEQNK